MINAKKVELMTGMAMFEKTRKTSLKQNEYFEKNAKYAIALKSMPIGLAIGVLTAFLVIEAGYDYFKALYHNIGMVLFIALCLDFVAVIMIVYAAISAFALGRKYENMRGSYVKYRLFKKELLKINDEEQPQA